MNTKEQVENWDKVLDEYEKGVGFSSYGLNKFDSYGHIVIIKVRLIKSKVLKKF